MRPETGDDAGLPDVFTSGQAAAAGYGRHRVATRVRRGEWVVLHRGVYCTSATWAGADRRERAVLAARAVARCRTGTVLSHLSAAAAWGWPLPLAEPAVWLTLPGGPQRRQPGLVLEAAALDPQEVAVIGGPSGWRVTRRARTVADCLRRLPLADAVAVADAAAARGLPHGHVLATLQRQGRWPYADVGRTALALVDPRRESWLESWSVVRLHLRGIPLPEPQARVVDVRGRFVARTDWWWPDLGVVGEADGREKYRRRGLRTPDDAERLLREEKEREDRLRDAGLEVVRYGTRDAVQADELVARWHRAVERADPGRVTARITRAPWPSSWPLPTSATA